MHKENFACANVSETCFSNLWKFPWKFLFYYKIKHIFPIIRKNHIFPMLHLLACTIRSWLPVKIGSAYQEERWPGPWPVWISEQFRDISALKRSFHLIHLTSLGYRCLTYEIGLVKSLRLPVKPLYLIWYDTEEMIFFSLKRRSLI